MNSWAFIRGFEILCKALDLDPLVGHFFYFYESKDVNKGTGVSFCAHLGKKIFPPYAFNFKKDWKDTFVKVKRSPNCVLASVLVEGVPKFPLSWTTTPAAIMLYDFDKMTPYEKGIICFLEKLLLSDIHKLLDKEGDQDDLSAYLCECSHFLLCLFSNFQVVSPFNVEVSYFCRTDGYTTSDPVGVQHQRVKRKDIATKAEVASGLTDMDTEQMEVPAVEGTVVEIADSPKRKKGRTGMGESKCSLPSGGSVGD